MTYTVTVLLESLTRAIERLHAYSLDRDANVGEKKIAAVCCYETKDRLRAAVEKMEKEIEHANKSASAWLKLQHAAEHERDDLRSQLELNKSAYKLLEECDDKLNRKLEYERSRADGNFHSYERIKDKYSGSVNVVKELKRRLEGAHAKNCECYISGLTENPHIDPRCLALRKGET